MKTVASFKPKSSRAFPLAASVLTLLALPAATQALTIDWVGAAGVSGTNIIGVGANWSGSIAPGAADIARWNAASYTAAPAVATSGTIGELWFTGLNTGALTFSGTSTLTLAGVNTSGTNIGIQLDSGSGAVNTGSAKFAIYASQSWTNNSASTLTIGGAVTGGANTLTLDGSGNGLTTLTGGLTFSGAGGLVINKTGTLGTTISGGTINFGGTGGLTINSGASAVSLGATTISASQSWANNSSNVMSLTGALTLTNQLTLTAGSFKTGSASTGTGGLVVNGGALQIAGNIASAGTGTLTLTSGKFSSDSTTARTDSSTLAINGSVTIGDATNTGGVTFSGASTITNSPTVTIAAGTGAVTFQTGAMTLNSNAEFDNNSANTFTISSAVTGNGNLALNATSTGNITVSNTANTFTGGLTILGGTVNVSPGTGALSSGTVTLGNTTGSAAATLSIGATASVYSNAIVLATNINNPTLTINNGGANNVSTTLSGGITGSGNVTINYTASGTTGGFTESGLVNNAGTLTFTGGTTNPVGFTLSGGVGSNVTAINANSTVHNVTISTAALTVNGSVGTTLTNNGGKTLAVSGGVIGTGNLILKNNSTTANGINLTTTAVNNTGSITNSGTGVGGTVTISSVGSNVTGITQSAIDSAATLTVTNLTVNGFPGTTLTDTVAAGLTVTNQITGTGNLTLTAGSTGAITLSGGANNAGTITNNGSGTNTVTVGAIGASVTGVTQNSTSSTLLLNGANTFYCPLNIQQGTVQLGNAAAAGIGTVTIGSVGNSSTLDLNAQTATIISLATAGTAASQTIGNSSTTALATLNYTGATASTFGGVIKNTLGSGNKTTALTLNNAAAVLTLTGSNTYTGATTVTSGLLKIGTGGSLAAGSAVGVTGGSIGGTGTIGGAVTVSSTGGINLSDGAVGTLTLGSTLSITGAAGKNNLSFDLGSAAAGADNIAVTGTVSMTNSGAGVINLNQIGGAANRANASTYNLITGSSVPASSSFTLATAKAFGETFALTGNATTLQVTTTQVTGATATAYWAGGANNWSTAANWKTDASSNTATGAAPDYTTDVHFYTTSPSAANLLTNTIDVDFDINSLTFDAAATSSVTIGGTKMLTIEGANGITVNTPTSGTPTDTISAKVGLASSQTWTVNTGAALVVSGTVSDFGGGYSLTKAGAGTLTLSGANTFSGGLVIKNGTVTATTSASALGTGAVTLGDTANNTAASLLGGTALTFANPIVLAANINNPTLTVGSTGNVAVIYSGGVTGTGNLTINDGGTSALTFQTGLLNNTGTITNAGTASNTVTISSVIGSNVTGVTQNNANSTLVLSGVNAFSGGLNIQQGTVSATTSTSALGTGTVTLGGVAGQDAKLFGNTSGYTLNNPINLSSTGGNLTIGNSANGTLLYGGTVSGTHDLILANNNNGALTFTKIDITGAITSNGTGASGVTITTLGANTGSLTLASTGGVAAGLTITNAVTTSGNLLLTNNSTSGVITLTGGANNTGSITNTGSSIGGTTISGNIGSNVTGGVIQNNPNATLTLSGSANAFTGGLYIKAGTVLLSTSASAAGGASNTITLGDATVGANATLTSATDGLNFANPITVASGLGTRTISGPTANSTSATYSGTITLNHDLIVLQPSQGNARGLTLSGAIAGSGNLSLQPGNGTAATGITLSNTVGGINNTGTITNTGTWATISGNLGSNVTGVIQNSTGTLILSAAAGSPNFIGDTTLTSGTLNLQTTNALQNSVVKMSGGNVTIGAGGASTITALSLGGLAGSGNINLVNNATTPAAVNLTLGNSNTSYASNTLNPTYSGALSGTASLTKVGSNTQTLSGANTYNGTTTVSVGTLVVSGSLTATSGVTIAGGAELKVNGLVNNAAAVTVNGVLSGGGSVGAVTVASGGKLSPGNSPGSLTPDSLTLKGGGGYKLELNNDGSSGAAGTNWDQVKVTNALVLNDASLTSATPYVLSLTSLTGGNTAGPLDVFDASVNHTWASVFTFGSITGTADSTLFTVDATGFQNNTYVGSFSLTFNANSADLQFLAVPEPATWALLVGGLGMVAFGQRLRRRFNT